MPMYTTLTVTASPDGYCYSDDIHRSAKTPRQAAVRHCEEFQEPQAQEVCVLVRDVETRIEDVYMAELIGGVYVIKPAVTPAALRIARRLIKTLGEIADLQSDDAVSLMRLLESIEIDCGVGTVEEQHPASREFIVDLNTTDALAGVRLLLHTSHGLDILDHSDIEQGGFTPRRA